MWKRILQNDDVCFGLQMSGIMIGIGLAIAALIAYQDTPLERVELLELMSLGDCHERAVESYLRNKIPVTNFAKNDIRDLCIDERHADIQIRSL